jgi:hypothetical protein
LFFCKSWTFIERYRKTKVTKGTERIPEPDQKGVEMIEEDKQPVIAETANQPVQPPQPQQVIHHHHRDRSGVWSP